MLPPQGRRRNKTNDPVYPVLNVYSCPRVSKQRVNNARIPLLKYRERVYANNHSKSYENDFIQASLLRKFQQKDGLIHSFKNMKNKMPEIKRVKVLICVCMYNQSKNAINLTLNGIYSNLANLRAQGLSDGDIGVVLIQDGILKLVKNRVKRTYVKGEQSMIQFYKKMDQQQGKDKCDLIERINIILDEIDNFDRKGMKGNVSRNRDFPPSIQKNIALVYQNLWRPSKTHFDKDTQPKDSTQRLRLFSCFKHTNGTKLSSHLWFFQGFCRFLKPQFCVLLDVGTTPDPMGIVNLIKGFSKGPDIGGCTGFMSVDSQFPSQQGQEVQQQNCCEKYCFSIERAQQYQYILSHFLDKNAESALGFLHVLPGAWSAYRYDALIKSDKYQPNLLERSYFKMILNPDLQQKDFQQANMYLAQDRILSLGIYCQMQSKNLLKYVPDAIAYTDPMKDHENLMNQRRRWINSSLFAFLYVFKNYYFNVMDSEHNFFRKYITLNISMFMALFSTITAYLTPSFYFFILYSTIIQLQKPVKDPQSTTNQCYRDYTLTGDTFQCTQYNVVSEWAAKIVSLIYVLVFLVAVGGSLTGRQWSKRAHIVSAILSFYTFAMVGLVVYNIITIYLKVQTFNATGSVSQFFSQPIIIIIFVLTVLNLGFMLIIYLMHIPTHCRFVWKLIANQLSYMAYTGAYSQTMVIHSFCNVDDVSWGTKGSVGSGVKKYEVDKVFFVSSWLFYNALLSYIFLYIDIVVVQSNDPNANGSNGGIVLIIIAFWVTITIVFKALFAIYYHFKWMIFEKCCLTLIPEDQIDTRRDRIEAYWKQEFKKQNDGERNNLWQPSLIVKKKK